MNINRQKAKSNILDLLKRPDYNNLEINSKGNFINILKDKGKLYLLIIPNKPLSETKSHQILNLGFKEKFPKTNYSRFIDYNNIEGLEKLIDDIVCIFDSVFQIPNNREWRFSTSSGMGLLKEMKPFPTLSECRDIAKTKTFDLKILFKFDILLSVIIGVVLGIVLIINGTNFGLRKIELFLYSVLLAFAFIKSSKLLEFFSDKSKSSRLFSQKRVDYFRNINFKKVGSRFKGERKGYKIEIYYNSYVMGPEIAIHHKEIPWERVVKLSKSSKQGWSTKPHINWGTEIVRIDFRNQRFMPGVETIVNVTDKLLEKLIELNIDSSK